MTAFSLTMNDMTISFGAPHNADLYQFMCRADVFFHVEAAEPLNVRIVTPMNRWSSPRERMAEVE